MAHPFFMAALAAHLIALAIVVLKGTTPERIAVGALIAAVLLQGVIIAALHFAGVDPARHAFGIDATINLFASSVLCVLACRYVRTWQLVALILQASELALDGFYVTDERGREVLPPAAAFDVLSVAVLTTIAVGAWRARRKRPDPDAILTSTPGAPLAAEA